MSHFLCYVGTFDKQKRNLDFFDYIWYNDIKTDGWLNPSKIGFGALLLISNIHHIFQFLQIFSDFSEPFTKNSFSWWKPKFHAYTWCFQLCFNFHTHQDIQNHRWASFALQRFWHNKTALKSLFDGFNQLQFL